MSEAVKNAELDRLQSESEIRGLMMRYARGVDRMNLNMVRSCYHPDATDDHGEYVGGVDGLIEFLREVLPKLEATQHFIGNFLVDIQGDEAFAETYVHSYTRARNRDGELVNRIRCVRIYDRLDRRNGSWLIADRHLVYDLAQTTPFASYMWGSRPLSGSSSDVPGSVGRIGPADPSTEWVGAWQEASGSTSRWVNG